MKTALITGASSGIGKELAYLMASQKVNLILTARRTEVLKKIKAELETNHAIKVTCFTEDLAQPNGAQSLFNAIKSQQLTVDYLVNNAGFGGQGYFHERSWKDEAAMLQLNISTLTQLCHLFLPEMVKRNSGRILNVASSAGLIPAGPLQSVYFATKAYVVSFSQGIAGELLDSPITITALCPGATATEFEKTAKLEGSDLFSGKTFTAKEVAQDGYNAMMNGELIKTTALTLAQKINIKLAPLVPKKMILKQIKEMQEIK